MEYDFCGWVTKNDLLCADGRVIQKDAFKHNDGKTVPLVWNHQHNDPRNILGNVLLQNCSEGVYGYGTFNNSESGVEAKKLVVHKDVCALSIYANQLKEQGSQVIHGAIREVSLVLAGANPGAFIEAIIAHGENSDGEAIIYTGEDISIEHADKKEEGIEDMTPEVKKPDGEKTVGDVFNSFTDEQKNVVYAMIGAALEDAEGSDEENEGDNKMKHNAFDQGTDTDKVLSHDAMNIILNDAKRCGSLKESFLQHAGDYGIDNIDWLFPEATNLNGQPEFIKRTPDAWVDVVMKGVHHSPFSRIKSMFADITADEARAKGYVKGNLKLEEVFGLIKRTTTPATVYKKQKLDRDDIVDITDFDVISWLKAEMRVMLDEELARAILFGDGRNAMLEDKIPEGNIRPVIKDTTSDFYAMEKTVTVASGEDAGHAIINMMVRAQDDYQGSGNIILFAASSTITSMLLLEDTLGHRLYKDMNDLALAMNINRIVKVPSSIIPTGYYGVALDLNDYNVGADKGGAINMFDDFDIDYNQQKYLIETRCSGALTKPHSAIVLKVASGS